MKYSAYLFGVCFFLLLAENLQAIHLTVRITESRMKFDGWSFQVNVEELADDIIRYKITMVARQPKPDPADPFYQPPKTFVPHDAHLVRIKPYMVEKSFEIETTRTKLKHTSTFSIPKEHVSDLKWVYNSGGPLSLGGVSFVIHLSDFDTAKTAKQKERAR